MLVVAKGHNNISNLWCYYNGDIVLLSKEYVVQILCISAFPSRSFSVVFPESLHILQQHTPSQRAEGVCDVTFKTVDSHREHREITTEIHVFKITCSV